MKNNKRRGSSFDTHRDKLLKKNKNLKKSYDKEIGSFSLSTQLAIARRNAGITQIEMAKKLSVSQSAIAQIENPKGNPTLRTVQKVANVLGYQVNLTST